MSVIKEVHAEREELARVLKKHSGIRRIVEDLYPDSAHFIFELLQNAEDTGATDAQFTLSPTGLVFEHNGRPFDERDIYAITDIGEGTKAEDDDKIGRFGVGFKAVFAYSETPHIWSPTFSFRITELVLPLEIPKVNDLGERTRFEFPFNNPKKSREVAYQEVEHGLLELAETSLLFLSQLESIRWQTGNVESGEVLRHQHSENHVEVLKQIGGKTTTSQHFLKFQQQVTGLEKQQVSIAYELELLPNIQQLDPLKPLAKQVKIVSAKPGRVAVFFPAEKETSGLRFHLHAPFVPELSRASIKETPANQPLFEQLANLSTASLHTIRDIGLLTGDFLSVLPNPQDPMSGRYSPIRDAIINEMNEQSLTPTYAKKHAAAKRLLQAKASLKDLLSEDDIEYLVKYENDPPKWAIAATQKNSNTDRFLSGLGISEWDIEAFVALLVSKTTEGMRFDVKTRVYGNGPDDVFMKWLSAKPVEWVQRMYALLFTELSSGGGFSRFSKSRIARQSDGSFDLGSRCFFPGDTTANDDALARVDADVLTCGKNKGFQSSAKKFLESIGVREVGEAEQVEVILQKRYTREAKIPSDRTYRRDFKRFVLLVESQPQKAEMFKAYYILENGDQQWATPSDIFLDEPYLETNLKVYFEALGDGADRTSLSSRYEDIGVPIKRVAKFVQAVGAQTSLQITQVNCYYNPEWSLLRSVGGERERSPINRDYTITNLETLLAQPSLKVSQLLWHTMSNLNPRFVKATYQRSERGGSQTANSQLIHQLRNAAWVPQGDCFVRPAEASSELLPAGFPYDQGWSWLGAIHFGLHAAKQVEENRAKQNTAKAMGFADFQSLERAKRFAAMPPDEQERILSEMERKAASELPDHEPVNPTRRAERVGAQAIDAPERLTEERTRSISIGREEVKVEAGQYLLQQYSDNDDNLICQVCKERMPFKMDDGTDYFEKVEFLTNLKKRHYQNYLALCPNHAAMYQHVNGSKDDMLELFGTISGNELEVVLAQQKHTIYFTKTHIADLLTVIEAEDELEVASIAGVL
jgi:hypothetical protein